jgi:hypothetical protein
VRRSNRLLLTLAILFIASGLSCGEERNVEFSVMGTYPELTAQLRAWDKLYIKLTYRSDRPVRFRMDGHAAGKRVTDDFSNAKPP